MSGDAADELRTLPTATIHMSASRDGCRYYRTWGDGHYEPITREEFFTQMERAAAVARLTEPQT